MWEEWDPIGVNGSAPNDEYDSYAFRVFVMMKENRHESEVADYLYWAASENMGMGGAGHDSAIAEDARLIARKIMAIRERMQ